MGRGGVSPAASANLPKVSFAIVQDDELSKPAGVHDHQARSYGYNDFADFRRPEHYIRYIEPLESELAVQVEYDMDEQDQEWLDALNAERKKEGIDKVTYEVFEIVMDRLEKEWFDLTKNIPKPDLALPSEDSTCAICDDSEGENSNAIVFCDGCNLAVHQDCYGVPYIPEGQWLCRKCTVSPENPVSCILCPNEGGAFKQTPHGEWVHLLCAIWVPETRVANDTFMEPITGIEKISKQRWKLKCSICEIREGACIQCSKTSCFLAFHTTCARKEKLLMPMKSNSGSEPAPLTCYCENISLEQYEARTAALAAEGRNSESPKQQSKSARAYAKTYKTGPPLVPAIVVERITQYIGKVVLRKKPELVLLMCKYWSLKREARRGAPLLKRLHLEPWTASAGTKQQTDEEKAAKLEHLKRLKNDLESVRRLAELSRKRESRKLKQAEIAQDILHKALFSHEPKMRMAFERIRGLDRQSVFKNPVTRLEAPDYFDVIKRPMCWKVIDAKLDHHEYWDIQAFKDDVNLVLNNALLYNKSGTLIYKTAYRIRTAAQPILNDLDKLSFQHSQPQPATTSSSDANNLPPTNASDTLADAPAISAAPDHGATIGDLEPQISILTLLLSSLDVQPGIPHLLTISPLESLFAYELGTLKPPPTPPPPPPPKPPKLTKRERKAAAARERKARIEKGAIPITGENTEAAISAAATVTALDASPGFRAPRTRRAVAAAAAFEAEAVAGSSEDQKRKRSGSAGTEVALVENVDKRALFTRFNEGWILPENAKRGGRERMEKEVQPPPRKKPRTDQGPSRLSVFSTSATENQTLSTDTAQFLENITADTAEAQGYPLPALSSDVPIHSHAPDALLIPAVVDISPETSMIVDADGTVVVQDLDTPAIRREKNMRKKAEKRRRVEIEAAMGKQRERPNGQEPGVPPREDGEDIRAEPDSDLTSLSSDDENETKEQNRAERLLEGGITDNNAGQPVPVSDHKLTPAHGVVVHQVVSAAKAEGPTVEPGAVILTDGQTLEGGTLVWAKADTYPWWPAVVFEEDDPEVPKAVLRSKPGTEPPQSQTRSHSKTRKKDAGKATGIVGPLHLVRFFDSASTWQWCGLEKLRMLGEDNELDQELIAPNSRKQRWKSAHLREQCREAYRRAMLEIEGSEDEEVEHPEEQDSKVKEVGMVVDEEAKDQPKDDEVATYVQLEMSPL